MAILELQDDAMLFKEIEGQQLSGEQIHRMDFSTGVRSLKVLPGTYRVALVYEHLAQPTCWEDGPSTHCWAVHDRGWWLPGATVIPGTIEWSPEAGKTYTVTRMEAYWAMTDNPTWSPKISLAQH